MSYYNILILQSTPEGKTGGTFGQGESDYPEYADKELGWCRWQWGYCQEDY